MLTSVAIEDEPLALKRLVDFINKVDFLSLQATFENSLDALNYLSVNEPEVVFLDIQMDELSGIQLIQSLNYRPQIVLITAFEEYAVKSFELQVTDYLLKPYSFERFLLAVGRLKNKPDGNSNSHLNAFVFIKTEFRLEKVILADIYYIQGMRDYRCIYMKEKTIMTLETFDELEKQLPLQLFCRVHKSYLVAIGQIKSVERDRIIINNELIPVGNTYKGKFYRLIKKI